MTMHRSLKTNAGNSKNRNVLKRYERVNVLKAKGEWKEGDRAYGLKKTKPSS